MGRAVRSARAPRRWSRRLVLAGLGALPLLPGLAWAAPELGAPAPAFSALDEHGRRRALKDFAGRIVVLEWTNSGCPYCGKHYGSGTMQALQRKAVAAGVVWLTVASSAPDMEGYFTPTSAQAWKRKVGNAATAILLDGDGKIGRAYGARATPTMFVIDKAGRVAYMGGIDDRPYADPESLKGAKPYVALALADLAAGRPVATPVSRPYGCAVKYASAE
ncbi:MAG: redoxin domain-containing protein [Proteobacteria bacterium]|nr:redoxin domain-containing protein [Pseudomonadota bacterium]